MYKNYQEINSKKTVMSKVKINQAVLIAGSFLISWIIKQNVTSKLSFLYVIFTTCCGIYLAMPSNTNGMRENYHAIIIRLFQRKNNVYMPVYEKDESL